MNTRFAGTILTLVLMALMASGQVAQGNDFWEEEYKVKSGQKIDLEMKYGGQLVVEGWDQDLVRIHCTDSIVDLDLYNFEIKETRSGLKFRAKLKKKYAESTGLKVTVFVPRHFDIESNSGGGGIRITDVSGEFKGETGGGRITLLNVSGEAHLSTGGGVIQIIDSQLDGKISTGGGGGIVRNVTGNIQATSGGGLVKYENVRDNEGDFRGPGEMSTDGVTSRTIMYSSAGGEIDLDEAPEGAMVMTGGGNIHIRGAERFVQAETGGGDIKIDIKDGSVTARTGAGDVKVVVEGGFGKKRDGLDLRTGHGEVTIIVPADASLEFDIDLGYTRSSSRSFNITSDFDLNIEHTKKWKKERGSSNQWKHVYGTASINGGDHKVVIHGVNGDIQIKRR